MLNGRIRALMKFADYTTSIGTDETIDFVSSQSAHFIKFHTVFLLNKLKSSPSTFPVNPFSFHPFCPSLRGVLVESRQQFPSVLLIY